MSLASYGAATITLYNRSTDKAEILRKALQKQYSDIVVNSGSAKPEHHDIAINATSVGMGNDGNTPFSLEKLHSTTLVCDIIIYPEKTPLLQQAESKGHPTHYGRAMLQQQITLMREYMLNQ
ncbi:shikimate dehydrogenase [Erwinia toletana]|uniref:Shikimate dehydrogenase n=1 Tax=Winslowiella toletana TaxID=92490 RepID=A0ABS4PFC6_9GAMM|nr:shikimate dehydrogenase [Winslowiella toletana]MBP2171354.1 shikimate dehydrogenase [Winslowiella toletana]